MGRLRRNRNGAKHKLCPGDDDWIAVEPTMTHGQLCRLSDVDPPIRRVPVALGRNLTMDEAGKLRNLFCKYFSVCSGVAMWHLEVQPVNVYPRRYPQIRNMRTWICHSSCPYRKTSNKLMNNGKPIVTSSWDNTAHDQLTRFTRKSETVTETLEKLKPDRGPAVGAGKFHCESKKE